MTLLDIMSIRSRGRPDKAPPSILLRISRKVHDLPEKGLLLPSIKPEGHAGPSWALPLRVRPIPLSPVAEVLFTRSNCISGHTHLVARPLECLPVLWTDSHPPDDCWHRCHPEDALKSTPFRTTNRRRTRCCDAFRDAVSMALGIV